MKNISEFDSMEVQNESNCYLYVYFQDHIFIIWPKLLIGTIIASIVYYYLYLPMNWVKNMEDVGLDIDSKKMNFWNRRTFLKYSTKRKKIGNVPPVFPNGWFMLTESDEVQRGQAVHVSALGENFAIFRGEDKLCYILDAYCPHIGANMGFGGKVKGNCLICPFHHWQFRGEDGKCVNIPYTNKVPEFIRVKSWIAHEINGFIFVWYDREGREPSWYPEHIPEIKLKQYIYRGRNEFYVNCHIQDVPENGSDLAHFNVIHRASLLTGSDLRFHEKWLRLFYHSWTSTWETCNEVGKEHIGFCKLTHSITLFEKFKLATADVDIRQIGPGYVELIVNTSYGPIVLLQTVTPVEALVQKLVHRIYCPPFLALYATFILFSECIMIERDIMIWNNKTYSHKPILVKEDRTITKYRRWFSQFYSENSPTLSSLKKNLDW